MVVTIMLKNLKIRKKTRLSRLSRYNGICLVSVPDNSILGWSDLPLFAILENGHIAADEVFFMS